MHLFIVKSDVQSLFETEFVHLNINSVMSSTYIIQYVGKWYVRKIIDHFCSVVLEQIPTLESTVKWETRQASFPTGKVGPRAGIFLSSLNINDGFYLSHIRCTIPTRGQDKNRTAARRKTSDVIIL